MTTIVHHPFGVHLAVPVNRPAKTVVVQPIVKTSQFGASVQLSITAPLRFEIFQSPDRLSLGEAFTTGAANNASEVANAETRPRYRINPPLLPAISKHPAFIQQQQLAIL